MSPLTFACILQAPGQPAACCMYFPVLQSCGYYFPTTLEWLAEPPRPCLYFSSRRLPGWISESRAARWRALGRVALQSNGCLYLACYLQTEPASACVLQPDDKMQGDYLQPTKRALFSIVVFNAEPDTALLTNPHTIFALL
jgi:hypothetical protein